MSDGESCTAIDGGGGGGGAQPKGTSTQAPPGVLSFVTYYDIRYQHYRFR